MPANNTYIFKARIYQTGINWCVDVPLRITRKLLIDKGYIRIRGTINGFYFDKSLVPVSGAHYRLFVNMIMMKGAATALGKVAQFEIQQDVRKPETLYPMPELLDKILTKNGLHATFEALTMSGKKEILRYLNSLKSAETIQRNIDKVIAQLKSNVKQVRVP